MSKLYKFILYALFAMIVVIICAPTKTESGRVIFCPPRRNDILTGQILSARPKEKPCPKCQMRDHRGHCRKLISFKRDGDDC